MQSFHRSPSTYIGLADLMRMILAGTNLAAYGTWLLDYVSRYPGDANALMDLSTILHIIGSRENAMARQAQALALGRLYRLPAAAQPAGLRLLVLAGAGDLQVNMPVEFLVESGDVDLATLYVMPGEPLQIDPMAHDVVMVAAGESDGTVPLLQWLETALASCPLPVLNRPERIAQTSREAACVRLASAPGVCMPQAKRIHRHDLSNDGGSEARFPLILRPVGSHGGHGLVKAEAPQDVAEYLAAMPDEEFYVTPYMDYRGPDGLFRKYRLVMIENAFFACHMAISDHWMIHYVNAGMADNRQKRDEEAHFMATFDEDFARRHDAAFQAIYERMGLDYLVIDCADTETGELLVFEADTGGVVHAMDPEDIFPYKRPQMLRIFSAFRAMLGKAANKRMVSLSPQK